MYFNFLQIKGALFSIVNLHRLSLAPHYTNFLIRNFYYYSCHFVPITAITFYIELSFFAIMFGIYREVYILLLWK